MGRVLLTVAGVFLIIAGVMVPLATVPIVFILPETFASTALISNSALTSASAIAREIEKIQSKTCLYRVISNLHLSVLWVQKFKAENDLPIEMAYGLLKKNLEVRQTRSTSVIDIKVLSDDKNEAAVIANEIADVYQKSVLAPIVDKKNWAVVDENNSAVHIIDKAEPGMRPVRPNKPLAIGIGCGVGLGLAVLGAGLIFISRKRTRTPAPG